MTSLDDLDMDRHQIFDFVDEFGDFDVYSDNESSYGNNTGYFENVGTCCPHPCKLSDIRRFNKVFLPVVYSLVFAFGCAGNLLVVVVLARFRRAMVAADTYMLHLAVADLLFVATLPFWATYRASQWTFGNDACRLIYGVTSVNFYSSIFLLGCISVDRYLAIVHAVKTHWCRRAERVQLICGVVWLVSFLLTIPDIVYSQQVFVPQLNSTECVQNYSPEQADRWRFSIRMLHHTLGFLLPLSVMLFCYTSIGVTLARSHGFAKQKALRVIVALVVAFFACWLPFNVSVFVDTLTRAGLVSPSCDLYARLDKSISVTESLGFAHCCLNPILYVFVGVKFRNNALKILRDAGCVSQRWLSEHVNYRSARGRSFGASVGSESESTASYTM
ncbi:C-X-C chemokine receptor type 1-like [Lethenteron reissneri]|uniref:C-X-C chemokine receptor type 1-like n=1 Tax=Lethenteron reissneri TaxID=7753 RepID=UPI002AB7E2F3|nr:C-X-C chemokine receptor type 1-like [Lethenteron reissneri]